MTHEEETANFLERQYDDWEDDPDEWSDGGEEFFDCGATPDGGCTKAGSEECDWECPYAGELYNS